MSSSPKHLITIHAFVTFEQADRLRNELRFLQIRDGIVIERFPDGDGPIKSTMDSIGDVIERVNSIEELKHSKPLATFYGIEEVRDE